MNGEKILDISWRTILKIFIAVAIFYILYSVRDILIWFIFALTISILFNPAINFLQKKRIPRSFAVVLSAFVTHQHHAVKLWVIESKQASGTVCLVAGRSPLGVSVP